MSDEWKKEFSKYVVWDPDEVDEKGKPSLTPHVDIDLDKALSVLSNHIKDCELDELLVDVTKESLIKTLKYLRFGDWVMYSVGLHSFDKILQHYQSCSPSKGYLMAIVNGNTLESIHEWREAQRYLTKLLREEEEGVQQR